MLFVSIALSAIIAAATAAHGEKDEVFFQDISHKAQYSNVASIADWERLPFDISQNGFAMNGRLAYGKERNCYFALETSGKLYATVGKSEYDKINLESPYSTWFLFHDLAVDTSNWWVVGDGGVGSMYFITDDNILKLSLNTSDSNPCGSVSATNNILSESLSQVWGEISSVTSTSDAETVWVAASSGINKVTIDAAAVTCMNDQLLSLDDPKTITSIYYVDAWSTLYVGTPLALYSYKYRESEIVSSYHEWIGAIIDTAPLGFAFDALHNALWLAESNSVHKQTEDGRWWRYGLSQGSPFISNITSVAVSTDCNFVWVGSDFGLARLDATASPTAISPPSAVAREAAAPTSDPWKWFYYGGNRYLVDNLVGFMISGGDHVLMVATSTGLTVVETALWTLAEKADAMSQFQSPRHDRLGLTTNCNMQAYGDLSTYWNDCSDNDGLWTSMHAMGQVYAYMTDKTEDAKKLAWTAFEALEFLNILPGNYPHFPARSYALTTDTSGGCTGDVWINSTVNKDYMWKSTTSSDELDGHLGVLPLIYDHIATTQDEKERVYALIEGITGGILDNDLYLIDPSTGEPTVWGFWNPEVVNDDPEHYSERGTNSLGILAYTASAYSITGDEKYKKTFWELVNEHGYITNTLNAKIDCPLEDNHSDNELLFMTYHTAFYALRRLETRLAEGSQDISLVSLKNDVKEMVDALIPSVDRMWTIVGGEKSPLWLGFYAGVCQRPASSGDISDAVWSLRHWAIDLITWPVDNTNRYNINQSPYYPRDYNEGDSHVIREIMPAQERMSKKWNSDPFEPNGGSGMEEEAPYVWLLPYYLMKYYKLV